ncbi:hypothetical protein EDD21DRAFT_368807 [Dissophora ornata]|nr:hypothetical protein EDD21DRAFT_368807 [Dissophora ornata]
MLYHALRLACIIVSSFKTWKAVVDSGDRSLARRYMFLWFLTLAGLSLEPIADSVLGPRIPMYEGFKIIIAGWLLLAHFYLTNPVNDPDTYQTWHIEQHPTRGQVSHDRGTSQSRQLYLSAPQKSSQTIHRDFRPEERAATSTAANLDFGRFKRDLERRRTANSVHSTTDYGFHNVSSSSKLRPDPSDLYPITSASALNKPAKAGEAFSMERKSPSVLGHYEFGSSNASRKRPSSAASFDPQNTRPTSRQSSRRRNLDRKSHPGVEPAEADSSTSRMTKRLRHLIEDERTDEVLHNEAEAQSRRTALEGTKDDEVVRRSESSLPLRFSRPRPPGKDRKEVLPHSSTAGPSAPLRRQDSQESRKRSQSALDIHSPKPKTEITSATFESRMKNVRDWLKERNPSMISPPLSTKSEFLNPSTRIDNDRTSALAHKDFTSDVDAQGFQKPRKRKAQRQIAPLTGPKRLAHEGRLTRSRSDEGARIYPEPNDTVSTAQAPLRRSESYRHPRPSQSHGDNPHDGVRGTTDPQRDQPTEDPFFPPANRSKLQKRNNIAPKSSVPTSTTAVTTTPSSAFTFRMMPNKSANPLITNSFVGDDENITISPLIKLRQSQLKQRQQEDFLGIRRDDSPAAARRAEEEGGLAFNPTLEAWEKDDDEALARNAALEAEAKGMKLGRELGGSASSLPSEEESAAVTSARKNNNFISASSSSLLRTVEFNGDPSRRPDPELRRKKQVLEVAAQPKTTNDSATAATTVSSSSKQRPASIQSLSSSFGKGDNRYRPSVFHPTRSLTRSGSQTRDREDSASRRQTHPGLYTPSKKKPMLDSTSLQDDPALPHKSTPTMSRYIQLSTLSDEEI